MTLGDGSRTMERPTDEELSGMTLNERLFACGSMDQFDTAARQRDRESMVMILTQAALTKEEAAWSTDTILANPAKYGF